MDLSKLPRLSETDKQAPPPQTPQAAPEPQAAPARVYYPVAPQTSGADIWINLVIGIIVQLMSSRFWSWIGSKLFGSTFTWTFSAPDGSPLDYTQTVYFMGDLAMVLFGLVLIAEGILLMISHNRKMVLVAVGFTCLATLMNLVYLIQMMTQGYGLQLFAALAVGFGVYIAMNQWALAKSLPR